MAARRKKTDPTGLGLYPEWSWDWPVNRRIIYNRASIDLEGKPRNPNRALLKWDSENKKWVGDIPDGPAPPMGTEGVYPFIMKPDGVASIFGPGLKDGPFPEHYEPLECPIEKHIMSNQRINPVIKIFKGGADTFAGLTTIRQQEAIPPYARELKLKEYEGRVIMVSGDIDGGWIYQAVVIDHAGPILTAVVEKLFGPLEYPVL